MASKQSALRSFLIAALAGAVGAGTYTLAADTSETDTGDQASSTTASSTVSPDQAATFTTAAAEAPVAAAAAPIAVETRARQPVQPDFVDFVHAKTMVMERMLDEPYNVLTDYTHVPTDAPESPSMQLVRTFFNDTLLATRAVTDVVEDAVPDQVPEPLTQWAEDLTRPIAESVAEDPKVVQGWSDTADEARRACETVGLGDLAERRLDQLSGGERQLALLARALAQEPQFIVLDEPTASLDFGNQGKVMREIRALASSGLGVLFTTHDPNHAMRAADRAYLLKQGARLAEGATTSVLNRVQLEALYGAPVEVLSDTASGTSAFLPG